MPLKDLLRIVDRRRVDEKLDGDELPLGKGPVGCQRPLK